MLVLTRKLLEKIVAGKGEDEIVITILKIQGDKVSIGIKAKKDTPIYRHELLLKEKPDDKEDPKKVDLAAKEAE